MKYDNVTKAGRMEMIHFKTLILGMKYYFT
jgi:hypothetical protein